MSHKSRLMYLDLDVVDLAASRRFYEDVLGLDPFGSHATSVSYRVGHVIVTLQCTAGPDRRILGPDRSITLTVLVEDVRAARDALEERGATLQSTMKSPAGSMVDFYDPDGHWFSLYEPSDAALAWPSAHKIRTLRDTAVEPRATVDGWAGLGDQELLYVFLYVEDLQATAAFYQEALGLVPMERNVCHRGMTKVPDGVVKYDAGGLLLTTHHVGDGDHAARHQVTTQGTTGVALGFHVDDLGGATAELSARGVMFTGEAASSPTGKAAVFLDPGGHQFFLCEPSAETMAQSCGTAIRRILAAER